MDKTAFYSSTEAWYCDHPLRRNRKRKLVVDSGASMHCWLEKILSSEKWKPFKTSRKSTTVITAHGKVQTSAEAQVYDHDFELFVTEQILEDTPAILSFGKLREEHDYSYEWACGQNPLLTNNGTRLKYNTEKLRSHGYPRIVIKLERKFVFHIVTTGLIGYFFESSNFTKWPYTRSSIGRPRRSYKIKDENKKKGNNHATSNRLRDLSESSEEFTENLADTEV